MMSFIPCTPSDSLISTFILLSCREQCISVISLPVPHWCMSKFVEHFSCKIVFWCRFLLPYIILQILLSISRTVYITFGCIFFLVTYLVRVSIVTCPCCSSNYLNFLSPGVCNSLHCLWFLFKFLCSLFSGCLEIPMDLHF